MSGVRKAVIFDLDGTLIDSMPLVMRAYAHALEPYLPTMTAEQIVRGLGGPPARFFAELIADPLQAAAALDRLEDYGRTHWKTIQPFDGMLALVRELSAAACAIGIWTGRERASTEWLLRNHGAVEFIEACVCGDDLPSHKPDPTGLDTVLRQLRVARDDAVYVGDSDVDLLAGVALGVRTVLVSHGRPLSDDLRAKAWRVVANTGEAWTVLREEFLAKKPPEGRP